jgi:hypothetical protein
MTQFLAPVQTNSNHLPQKPLTSAPNFNSFFKELCKKGKVRISDGELRRIISLKLQARFKEQTITETGTELKIVDYELKSDVETKVWHDDSTADKTKARIKEAVQRGV